MQQSIPYEVMGGVAVRAYAVPRPTYDIDLKLTVARSELPKLFERLKKQDYVIPEVYESGWIDEVKGLKVLKLVRYIRDKTIDVDLFLSETKYQAEVMIRRQLAEAEDRKLWLVSPEDLVLLKLLAGRPRDLGDVTDVLFM